jgi:hypothetical protein
VNPALPVRLVGILVVLTVGLPLAGAACSRSEGVDQRVLHSVMLGTDEVIDARASRAVDLVGLRLRALGPSLGAAIEAAGDPAPLARLEADVTGLAEEVAAGPSVVRRGFAGYVARWEEIADAQRRLAEARRTGDEAAAVQALADTDAALVRLQALDRQRLERVVEAFGEEEAARLLEAETVPSG